MHNLFTGKFPRGYFGRFLKNISIYLLGEYCSIILFIYTNCRKKKLISVDIIYLSPQNSLSYFQDDYIFFCVLLIYYTSIILCIRVYLILYLPNIGYTVFFNAFKVKYFYKLV